MNPRTAILIRTRNAAGLATTGAKTAAGLAFDVRPLHPFPIAAGLAAAAMENWVIATPSAENADRSPWEWAHALAAPGEFAEPDLNQGWNYAPSVSAALGGSSGAGVEDPPDDDWPHPPRFAWHLTASQLDAARRRAPTGKVRIAHLDTGFDPTHITCPRGLIPELGFNFVDENHPEDARDPANDGGNAGHGTGTIGILAGNTVSRPASSPGGRFHGDLGGAPNAEVIPVRIANSVIHFKTSSMAQGLAYAIAPRGDPAHRCDVVTISMGGVPSQAWADAVNAAYENGIVIVAAAGNRLGKSPPYSMVWPARFRRVIAACGANSNGRPYYRPLFLREVQGCFGPQRAMRCAMAAYTPNVPWAEAGSRHVIDLNGAGTSSATPQIAAAAALWLQMHGQGIPNTWRRVESVRHALFTSALRLPGGETYFGNGILRADAALSIPAPRDLQPTQRDSVVLPLFKVLVGLRVPDEFASRMLSLEAMHHITQSEELDRLCADAEEATSPDDIRLRLLTGALSDMRKSSSAFRGYFKRTFSEFKRAQVRMPDRRTHADVADHRTAKPKGTAMTIVDTSMEVSAALSLFRTPALISEELAATGTAQVIVAIRSDRHVGGGGGSGGAGLGMAMAATCPAAAGLAGVNKTVAAAQRLHKFFTGRSHARTGHALASASLAATSKPPATTPDSIIYENLGLILGTVDSAGLEALRNDPEVAAVAGAPRISLIRPTHSAAAAMAKGTTWGLERLRVPQAWKHGYLGQGVVIAHLDTGVDASHPALKGAIEKYAYINDNGQALERKGTDSGDHGTHTAGTIAGRTVSGQNFGVAPQCRLVSAEVIEGGQVIARILGGLNWVVTHKPRALSMSLGLRGYHTDFEMIINVLRARDILPIIAVGNEGPFTSRSPGNYDSVLSVGAISKANKVADFSGSQRFARAQDPLVPDLVGPGVDTLSCTPGNTYALMSGSSMATPHIAGLAALLFSARPQATGREVEQAILASCRRPAGMDEERVNRGVPDAVLALEHLLGRTLTAAKPAQRAASAAKGKKKRTTKRPISKPARTMAKKAGRRR